ncbi:thiol-disulfide oxidoreductase DCC family protein [Bacillus sp. B1-b2]|uniref:thiol-disulfide oxidoreductase DCC family protein n=1 Tax=Bacillus sp. B1-b2 TaxID=2653201 RepID=UPI001261C83C|nr:thiol-disulfide oxidoreductase DCC family protein [Bacillus sp. B1-b2]KAB7671804.1 thiol-disulfide oxidoreductase DCC family protein [Bacillus sp. B1-b2]
MIILFDGVCNLCSHTVTFIIKRDPNSLFSFTSIQGKTGEKLIKDYHIPNVDSVILIKNGKYYIHSDAVLEICLHLGKAWRFFYILKIIPKFIRDPLYEFVARNRYKWFGKQESCMLPTEELKKRFL